MSEVTIILKELKDRIRAEAKTISDVLDLIDLEIQCAEAWEQIDKMSPEGIRACLLAHGYTEESLRESQARLVAMVKRLSGENKEKTT